MTLIVLAAAVTTTPRVDYVDGEVRLAVARALIQGRIDVPLETGAEYLTPPGTGGRFYGIYGVGQSLLLVPLELSGRIVGRILTSSQPRQLLVANGWVAFAYSLLLNGGLALVAFELLRRLGCSGRSAASGTVLCYLTSPWAVWGRSLQEESLAALVLFSALHIGLTLPRARRPVGAAFAAGLLLGFLANVRYNALFGAAAVGLFVLVWAPPPRWRVVVALGLGALPGLALALGYNLLRFGSPLQFGYQAYAQQHELAWRFKLEQLLSILAGFDFGLLWLSTPLLLLPALICRGRGSNARSTRLLAALGAAAVAAQSVYLAGHWLTPSGQVGYSGSRYLAHDLILLAPATWIAWRWLAVRGSKWTRLGVVALVLGGTCQGLALPLTDRVECLQDLVVRETGASRAYPGPLLPRRVVNLAWMIRGDLAVRSLPAEPELRSRVDPALVEGLQIAARPNLFPWRLAAGSQARDLPWKLRAALIGAWALLPFGLLCAAWRWWRLVRR